MKNHIEPSIELDNASRKGTIGHHEKISHAPIPAPNTGGYDVNTELLKLCFKLENARRDLASGHHAAAEAALASLVLQLTGIVKMNTSTDYNRI